jgi:hypothetical protein
MGMNIRRIDRDPTPERGERPHRLGLRKGGSPDQNMDLGKLRRPIEERRALALCLLRAPLLQKALRLGQLGRYVAISGHCP